MSVAQRHYSHERQGKKTHTVNSVSQRFCEHLVVVHQQSGWILDPITHSVTIHELTGIRPACATQPFRYVVSIMEEL